MAHVGPMLLYVFRTSKLNKAEAFFQVEIRLQPGGPHSEQVYRSDGRARPFEEAKAEAVARAREYLADLGKALDYVVQGEAQRAFRRRSRR